MFKYHKHVYTCPDVIYLRNRQKKINIANIAVTVLGTVALWGYGYWADKNEAKNLAADFLLETE